MDDTLLTVLRGKITALEKGYEVGIYSAEEVSDEANTLLRQHNDMPKKERARLEALALAGTATRGKPS